MKHAAAANDKRKNKRKPSEFINHHPVFFSVSPNVGYTFGPKQSAQQMNK